MGCVSEINILAERPNIKELAEIKPQNYGERIVGKQKKSQANLTQMGMHSTSFYAKSPCTLAKSDCWNYICVCFEVIYT